MGRARRNAVYSYYDDIGGTKFRCKISQCVHVIKCFGTWIAQSMCRPGRHWRDTCRTPPLNTNRRFLKVLALVKMCTDKKLAVRQGRRRCVRLLVRSIQQRKLSWPNRALYRHTCEMYQTVCSRRTTVAAPSHSHQYPRMRAKCFRRVQYRRETGPLVFLSLFFICSW